MQTITAKITPPAGPKSARPKSKATVLLIPTVALSSTTKYDTFANKKSVWMGLMSIHLKWYFFCLPSQPPYLNVWLLGYLYRGFSSHLQHSWPDPIHRMPIAQSKELMNMPTDYGSSPRIMVEKMILMLFPEQVVSSPVRSRISGKE